MSLFSECYADQAPAGTDCAQSGCGLGNISSLSMEPFVSEIKKGILSASASVLKQLRRKQAGAGARGKHKAVKRNKKQSGGGKKQSGGGKKRIKHKKQGGAGRKKSQSGAGRKKVQAGKRK
jgi:hypothetical protein